MNSKIPNSQKFAAYILTPIPLKEIFWTIRHIKVKSKFENLQNYYARPKHARKTDAKPNMMMKMMMSVAFLNFAILDASTLMPISNYYAENSQTIILYVNMHPAPQ